MSATAWARYALRKLGVVALTLFASSLAIYGSLAVAPGDPAANLAGTARPDPRVLAQVRAEYHLDDPWWLQYLHWLGGFVTGDLGRSMVFRADVSDLLAGRASTTLLLVLYAGLLILGPGVGLGVLAGLSGNRVRQAVSIGTTVAMGAPTFVVAIVLITIFSTSLSWFPVYGGGSGLADRLWHLTLPAVALAFSYVAYVAAVTRGAVAEELGAEHVDTARSRGLPRGVVNRRHVLRNATAPVLAVSGLTLAGLLAGTAVAEQAFGINGLGSLLIQSAAKKDFAVVQVISLLMVTVFVVVNAVVDTVNAALDPRTAPDGAVA